MAESSPNSGQNILPLYRRASFASFHDGGSPRRNSTEKSSSSNSGKNIPPHHLRASTGSCHDFCKYGRQHTFEAKARRPIIKKMTSSPSDKQNNTSGVVPMERKKTTVVKLKPSADSKVHSYDPSEIINREISLPSKKVETRSKQVLSNNRKMKENEMKIKCSPVKPKPVMVKSSSSSDISLGLNARRKSDVKFGKKMGTSPTASLSPKPPVSRVLTLNARKYRSLKLASPLKDQNSSPKVEPKKQNNDKVQEKTLHVVEAENENKTLESVQNGGIFQYHPSKSFPSSKSSSHPTSPSLSSHEEDLEDSEYTDTETDEFISQDDEIETSNGNKNSTPRKGGMVLSEDKDCASKRLKFRKGKVVDLQCENNGPRRLKFRRRRVLGDNEDRKGNARRSFKKREDDDGTNCTNPSSEKVVLRHQDVVQGKKDALGLFNNVIEETASKLVESRKSKVKALVGAFETVISLQESKPSTPTAT